MIYTETILNSADNSGAKKMKCIKVLGGSKRQYAIVGDVIVVSIREVLPNSKVKKGDVYRALIVRVVKETIREDGSVIRFSDNAAVLVNKSSDMIGTRVFGPISREIRNKGFTKIASLAPEVL